MDLTMRRHDGVVILKLNGRLDAMTSPQFDSYVSTIFDKIKRLLIINLYGLNT